MKKFNHVLKMVGFVFLLSSCIVNAPRDRTSSGITNTSDSVDEYYGRALHGNPFTLSENYNLSPVSFDMSKYLYSTADYITSNQFLQQACEPNGENGAGYIFPCFEVRKEENEDKIDPDDNKWAFPTSTQEFLEVNLFWHIKYQLGRWEDTILKHWTNSQTLGYTSAMPDSLYSTYANWRAGETLKAYSHCDLEDNAYFSPSEFILCFGYNSDYNKVKYAQDHSIIYHELGHSFTDIAINIRNTDAGLITRTDLGYGAYDEANSINEGISDFYVYFMTGEKMFGEWALDSFDIPYILPSAARPMSEDQDCHPDEISTDYDSRLSYPEYVTYNAYEYQRLDGGDPEEVEDIHYSGQIASHYWVALTEDLMDQCNMTQSAASAAVMSLIVETLAELGDQTATGADGESNRINHSATWALEWIKINKPITFRSFFQTFAKYLYLIYNQQAQCAGASYSIDRIEAMLDRYGLLLFRTYNEDGNSHAGTHTAVTVTNRIYSQLTSKDYLVLDPRSGAYDAVVIDNRTDMQSIISTMESSGLIEQHSSLIPDDLRYNNSNSKLNPGEIVALSLNLYNNSNTTMGGVQLLANDWDHIKDGKPCGTFEDEWPQDTEGAADDDNDTSVGGCEYTTRDNGTAGTDKVGPVCFVQISEDDATIWATQEKMLDYVSGLTTADCLDPDNPQSCFVRFIKGADTAFYSKIDPASTWSETLAYEGIGPTYQTSNLLFMEISPKIQPGTTINCRFRARFTNCNDCYSDSEENDGDDFLDYEFSGADPYKIINFKFTVNN